MVQRLKPSQYREKVHDAIDYLDDTQGSRPCAIIGYISSQCNLDSTDTTVKQSVYRALKQGLEDNSLVRTSSGLYTLATRVRRRPIRRRKKAKRRAGKRKTKRKKAKRRKKARRGRKKKAKRSQSSVTQVKRKRRKRRKPKKSASGSQSQIRRKGKRTRRRSRAEDDPYAAGKRRKVNPDSEIRPKRQKKSTSDASNK